MTRVASASSSTGVCAAPTGPRAEPALVDAASQLRRLRQRMASVAGEDPRELASYTHRLTGLVPPPWRKIFGERSMAAVLAGVKCPLPGLEFRPGDVFATGLRPSFGAGAGDKLGVIGVLSDVASGAAVGFFLQTFTKGPDGKVRDFIDYVIGTAPGQGAALTAVTDDLARLAESSASELKTAWLGRYYWAQRGYDFASLAERGRVMDRFGAFLRHYGREGEQLVIPDGGGFQKVGRGRALGAMDLAKVQSTGGQITVPSLVSHGGAEPLTAHLGKAFLLGDWRDPKVGHLFVRNWMGVRAR